ncbi:MAG TPA: hypothetical protein VM120_23765 [Bryobacteraceae bacterium]|nr:hypothetical protein [Bryobacteraceae bacterium]
MRRTRLALCLLATTFSAAAQQQGKRGMYGGVSTGQMVGVTNNAGFASGLGATVSGLPQTAHRIPMNRGMYGSPNHGGWPGRGGRTLVVPYGVPVGYGYGYGYDAAPMQTIVQPVQTSPSVIINQYYSTESVRPQLREYTDLPDPIRPPRTEVEAPAQARVNPPRQQPAAPRPAHPVEVTDSASRPTLTLLAFKDSSVVSSIAYWVQGEQLHYVTKTYVKRVVPLSSLDKATSAQLNRERNVEFLIE